MIRQEKASLGIKPSINSRIARFLNYIYEYTFLTNSFCDTIQAILLPSWRFDVCFAIINGFFSSNLS